MNLADLIAIDVHTHLEVSCRNPFDNYGEEFDRAADKYFRSSKRPTMQETIEAGFKDAVKPLILKDNAARLLKLGAYATAPAAPPATAHAA